MKIAVGQLILPDFPQSFAPTTARLILATVFSFIPFAFSSLEIEIPNKLLS